MTKILAPTVALITIIAFALSTFLFLENRYMKSSEISDIRQELKQFLMRPGLQIESDSLTIERQQSSDNHDFSSTTHITFTKSFKKPPTVVAGISSLVFDSGSRYVVEVEAITASISIEGFDISMSKPRDVALRSVKIWWLAYGE